MKTERIFLTTISVVTNIKLTDIIYNTRTIKSTPYDKRLVYVKDNQYYDLITKDKYIVGIENCEKTGDQFIDLNYQFYSLSEILNQYKTNISRRKLIKMYKLKKRGNYEENI